MCRAGKHAVVACHVFDRSPPQHRGTPRHLPLDLLRSGNGGQARIEGNPAAAGRRRIPDGIGIDHGGGDIIRLQA